MCQAILSLLDSIFGLSKLYKLHDKLFAQKIVYTLFPGEGDSAYERGGDACRLT